MKSVILSYITRAYWQRNIDAIFSLFFFGELITNKLITCDVWVPSLICHISLLYSSLLLLLLLLLLSLLLAFKLMLLFYFILFFFFGFFSLAFCSIFVRFLSFAASPEETVNWNPKKLKTQDSCELNSAVELGLIIHFDNLTDNDAIDAKRHWKAFCATTGAAQPSPATLISFSLRSIPVPILELHANWVIRERGRKERREREASLHIPSDTSYIMHIVYRLSFIIHFRDFQHICFFGNLICLRVTKIVSCSIFTPHTLGEPNSLQSVWQAEGTQRWHRHTRRQRSMRHRMMRMRSAIAVRMWPQIAGFEKSSSH